jgi:hypothetical protein
VYPRFSCFVPMVYLLSQVVSCVSVFLSYPFLGVPLVFLFVYLWFTYFHRLCLWCPCFWVICSWMYPRFSCLVPLVFLLSQVVASVSVFLGYLFLNVPSVFLFGPFALLTFTGCVLCVGVFGLSVLKCTLGFPVWYLWFTYFHRLCLVCPCFSVIRS